MKLSDLEKLVAAMRTEANKMDVTDPNVEFYDNDRLAFRQAFTGTTPFANMEPEPGVADNLRTHVVTQDGTAACRGDFAIPLQLV